MTTEPLPKILLVDDLHSNLLALKDTLEDIEAELLTARSGNEALTIATEQDLALILLDVQMPDMDGFEVATLMRCIERTENIPIIFVSAAGRSQELTFRGYEAGAVDYIHKPIEEHVLQSKVQVFLRLYRYQRQVERQNKELEQRVADRTRELEVACQDAQAANLAKSQFLANMSHEIRTPMTAILGYADILLNDDESEVSPAQRRESLSTIHRNGEYLIGIINDILDLSKIESGKLLIEQIECSPIEILQEVVTLIQVRAKAKSLDVEFETEGPLPKFIHSDPTRLRQILLNIVGNAVKFTQNGKVRLVARLVGADSEAPILQIDVVDTGIGLTDEQIDKLFQPFVQADTSTTRRFGGTGLGLTISRRLAEALGGGIDVASVAGEGSTFTINIATGSLADVPMVDGLADAKPVAAVKEQVNTQLNCRVLLAEDGPDNRRLISFILKKAGAETTVAENGQIATELALAARDEENPFDVILMDMQMPVMDGYTATGTLREAGYTGPIIALTAHAMSSDRNKCLAVGCDDYATKPINRENLISMVAQYASQQNSEEFVDV